MITAISYESKTGDRWADVKRIGATSWQVNTYHRAAAHVRVHRTRTLTKAQALARQWCDRRTT